MLPVAQEGFEPSASLVLSESGLPVAYRAEFQREMHDKLNSVNLVSSYQLYTRLTCCLSGSPPGSGNRFISGGWNRTSGLHVQSVMSLPTATAPESFIREGGFEPPPPDSKSGSLPLSRFPRASGGSRTRIANFREKSPCHHLRSRTHKTNNAIDSNSAGSGIRTPVAWLEARSRAAGPIPQ